MPFFSEKQNLCLYGFPFQGKQWEVNLPAEEVPPELPEAALGIHFASDGIQEKDWLSFVAVHRDAWLLSAAFCLGARFGFDKAHRKRLFTMINELPTTFEIVSGTVTKQSKEKSSISNHNSNKSKSTSKGKSVVKESVLIMPHFDFQLETHYRSGRISCRFVPVSKILKPLLLEHGNVGLIFTKGDLKEVIEEVGKYKVGAPARVGLVAPIDVVVPPGNTGLDPSHKSFFQVLNIPIKINKGIVEIITPVELIRKGDKAGSSEAALLAKVAESVYDDGLVFIPEVLDLTEDMGKFASCVSMVTALSLAIAYPTLAAAPHMFADAYKNVLAIAVGDRLHLPSGRASKRVLEGSEQLWLLPRKRRRNQSLKRSLMPMV